MMRSKRVRACLLALGMSAILPCVLTTAAATPAMVETALQQAVAGSWREPANVARDAWRHPAQTLTFFGIKPNQTVIEITPGSGWYSEILAPYLRAQGQYVAAVVDAQTLPEGRGRDYQQRASSQLQSKFDADANVYDKAKILAYAPQSPSFGADGSADLVLTFRNVHNWRGAGQAEGMFAGFYKVLKPGGVLGVVEHRAKTDVPADDKSGYVGQQQVIAMAKAAGFELAGSSEINANPRDSKDYPGGVWTLPPTNRHDAADAGKYQAVGESDRMTLKFIKP